MQYGTERPSAQVLESCEKLRVELATKWLGAGFTVRWQPKCDIVLHTSDASYLQAVGSGASGTIASSLIDQQKGQIRQRRIDVRALDNRWQVTALPHELTHVIMSDRFVGQRLPRWADEGLAILADPTAKQDGHLRDFRRAWAGQGAFRVVELMTMDDYPAAHRWATFYGQSVSLAQFLVGRGTPEQFVKFLHRSLEKGYEPALRETYNIASINELEREWTGHVKQVHAISAASPDTRELLEDQDELDGAVQLAGVARNNGVQMSLAPASWQVSGAAD